MKRIVFVAMVCSALCGRVCGDLVLGNLDNTPLDVSEIIITATNTTSYIANQFTTGTEKLTLNTVKISFGSQTGITNASFKLLLYTDSGSGPGSLVSGFDGPDNPNGTVETYTISSNGLLSASTAYWVVATKTSGVGTYTWKYTTDTTTTSLHGWSMGVAFEVDEHLGLVNPLIGGPQLFEIDAIPEPTTVALLGVFGAGLIFCNRRLNR